MKKVIIIGLIVLSVMLLFFRGNGFQAERILAASILKNRGFKGKVVEVLVPDSALKAYLMEEHSVPMVAVSFGFDRSGKAYEPVDGVALMAESVLLDGAGKYSRQELRAFMKEKGIRLSVEAGRDRLSFGLIFVKGFQKEAMEVLKAVLYEPRLDEADLREARLQLKAIRHQQEEHPQYYLGRLVDEVFYHNHPYAKEDIADEEVLAKVGRDEIFSYLQAYLGQDNLKVGIAGDMTTNEAEAFLKEAFGGLREKSAGQALDRVDTSFNGKREEVKVDFSAQSLVLILAYGVKRDDKDFYPLYLANYILGGSGLNSLLNKEVREKRGLTYGIYSGFSNADAVDLWQVSYSATPQKAKEAYEAALQVYADFYQNGVSEEMLQQAKEGLMNSFNLRFSGLSEIAEMLEMMQVLGLGRDFLETRQEKVSLVKLDEVNDAIKRRMPETLGEKGSVLIFEASGK